MEKKLTNDAIYTPPKKISIRVEPTSYAGLTSETTPWNLDFVVKYGSSSTITLTYAFKLNTCPCSTWTLNSPAKQVQTYPNPRSVDFNDPVCSFNQPNCKALPLRWDIDFKDSSNGALTSDNTFTVTDLASGKRLKIEQVTKVDQVTTKTVEVLYKYIM